jgi:diguanylate cyclase (GGDEF)-like protein/PAS domain S-box-containing protein
MRFGRKRDIRPQPETPSGGQDANTESMNSRLHELEEENASLQAMHEEAMARVNSLTMDAELAHLEFEQVFDSVGDPTWVLNSRCEVLRINKAFLSLLGLKTRSDAISKKCHDLLPAETCHTEQCPLLQIRKDQKRVEMDVEICFTEHGPIPFLVTSMPFLGLTGELIGIVEQFKNIAERKRYEDALHKANTELQKLATIDALTQLSNRRIFDQQLKTEWKRLRREKAPLSLILCDVDFFKQYNDYYGHQAGDECLKDIAACMNSCIHRPSDLLARYGGEEFVVLLPHTTREGAITIAETIRKKVYALGREHARSDVSESVTISLGVASVVPPLDGQATDSLLKQADEALYASKAAGRNRVTAAGGPRQNS